MNRAEKIYEAKVQLDNREYYEPLKAPMVKTTEERVNRVLDGANVQNIRSRGVSLLAGKFLCWQSLAGRDSFKRLLDGVVFI